MICSNAQAAYNTSQANRRTSDRVVSTMLNMLAGLERPDVVNRDEVLNRGAPSRVAVVGGGVIGLTTGIVLLESGVDVRLYAESLSDGIASSAASAMWLSIPDGANDVVGPESRQEVNESSVTGRKCHGESSNS